MADPDTGVLLVNLGTPGGAHARGGAPLPARVPLRSARGAAAAARCGCRSCTASSCRTRPAKIRGEVRGRSGRRDGSPLARPHRAPGAAAAAVAEGPAAVEYAMRYGEPSIAVGPGEADRLRVGDVVPLYPQYSREHDRERAATSLPSGARSRSPGLPRPPRLHRGARRAACNVTGQSTAAASGC